MFRLFFTPPKQNVSYKNKTPKQKIQEAVSNGNIIDYSHLHDDTTLYGYCDRVYDGDTVHVVCEISGGIYRINIRCENYDSPEMRPRKNIEHREEIIEEAKKAKTVMESLILNKFVNVHISKDNHKEKYGRFLATIYREEDNLNVNQYMIENGYGYEYHGGTKS